MILNVNEDDVEQYREKYGIKHLFTGQVKQLVDIEFVGDLQMAEETQDPPLYNLNEPEDEFYVEESDFSDEEDDDNTEEEIDSEEESDE